VHSLDLLYERETTSKLLEFKLKYLMSYATLMRNYFMHMNFGDIVQDLMLQQRDDANIMLKGKQLVVIAVLIVAPGRFVSDYFCWLLYIDFDLGVSTGARWDNGGHDDTCCRVHANRHIP
jgi:hypothetical protein